jgi:hypothetical protein
LGEVLHTPWRVVGDGYWFISQLLSHTLEHGTCTISVLYIHGGQYISTREKRG